MINEIMDKLKVKFESANHEERIAKDREDELFACGVSVGIGEAMGVVSEYLKLEQGVKLI